MNKFSKFTADVICELHPLFRGLVWVAAARSNDEERLVLNHVLVEREGLLWNIVATDGRRLHVHTFDPGLFDTDIDTIEEGLYEVIAKSSKLIVIAPADVELNYPNWRQVVPEHDPQFSDVIEARMISRIGIKSGVLLASDFASDAIGFGHGRKKDDSVDVTYGSSDMAAAFVIEHDLGKAIVMPVRIHDDGGAKDAPKTDAEATPDLPGMKRAPLPEDTEETPDY